MVSRLSGFGLAVSLLCLCGVGLKANADPVDGEQVFKQQCAVCHSVQPGQTLAGPSLAGVMGRTAGTLDSFRFSPSMKKSGIVWSKEQIDAFLESPRRLVSGTSMAYPGERNPAARAAIVDYLAAIE